MKFNEYSSIRNEDVTAVEHRLMIFSSNRRQGDLQV